MSLLQYSSKNRAFTRHSLGFISGLLRTYAVNWHSDAIQCVLDRLFGKALWVGGQQLSLWLRCIYSPKRVSRLSCQSCFNDLHRRLLHTSCYYALVALSGVSLGGWLDTAPNRRAERWRCRQTNIRLRREKHIETWLQGRREVNTKNMHSE